MRGASVTPRRGYVAQSDDTLPLHLQAPTFAPRRVSAVKLLRELERAHRGLIFRTMYSWQTGCLYLRRPFGLQRAASSLLTPEMHFEQSCLKSLVLKPNSGVVSRYGFTQYSSAAPPIKHSPPCDDCQLPAAFRAEVPDPKRGRWSACLVSKLRKGYLERRLGRLRAARLFDRGSPHVAVGLGSARGNISLEFRRHFAELRRNP